MSRLSNLQSNTFTAEQHVYSFDDGTQQEDDEAQVLFEGADI